MQQMDASEPERRLSLDNDQCTAEDIKQFYGEEVYKKWAHFWTEGGIHLNVTN